MASPNQSQKNLPYKRMKILAALAHTKTTMQSTQAKKMKKCEGNGPRKKRQFWQCWRLRINATLRTRGVQLIILRRMRSAKAKAKERKQWEWLRLIGRGAAMRTVRVKTPPIRLHRPRLVLPLLELGSPWPLPQHPMHLWLRNPHRLIFRQHPCLLSSLRKNPVMLIILMITPPVAMTKANITARKKSTMLNRSERRRPRSHPREK
mmetsp:Transcript_10942/g.18221  ORF Transcript_10942/g.18221 Transcript_10942/m.18221 type:complete len:206 (-) Transcript_10942:575-1192(-)